MARKVIDIDDKGSKSFQTERFILERFKRSLSKNDNIMMAFATFKHGSQFNIISPFADLDLHTFLDGDYGDFHQRSAGFEPRFLFEETWGLAVALKFLHRELALPSGPVSCAHFDLKPENILVEWSRKAVSTDHVSTSDMYVGRWKITDFGISVVNPLYEVESRSSRFMTPGDMIRERSVNPPRDPGPFQAPEMQKHKSLRVSTSSDMWSFGCIITMILAFALGGPGKVGELYTARCEEYKDDYFYTHISVDRPVVKPQVEMWLRGQVEADSFKLHREWISKCHALILQLLVIDKGLRSKSENASDGLYGIFVLLNNLPLEARRRLWVPEKLQLQQGSDESSLQEPNNIGTSEHLPSAPALVSCPPQGDQALLQSLNRPELPAFARLEVPSHVKQTALSPCGSRVAFLSRSTVYVYVLSQLHRQNAWSTSPNPTRWRIEKDSSRKSFQRFDCLETRQWTSVLLAGHFIALVSKPKHSNEYSVGFTSVHLIT